MADPVKKKVADVLTGAALKAAKKRAAKKTTTEPIKTKAPESAKKSPTTGAAASKALGEGKSVTAADVARAAKKQPGGYKNPAARKLGRGRRPQPADIAKSKAPNAAEAAKSLKSKSAKPGGAARQATGNKSGASGKFEKGQKKAPLTRTEKVGIAGATLGTAAFVAKDRNQSGRNVTKADKKMTTTKGSTEAQMESARAAEKKRYEARKKAALARAKAQSDFFYKEYKKKKDSEKGYLRDSEGKRVKSGFGEDIRTGYKKGGRVMKKAGGGEVKPVTPTQAMRVRAKEMEGMTKEQRMAKLKKEMPRKPGPKRVKYKSGGAVKGCGMAKRGFGKAMKK